jgi:hypothetical protein
MQGSPAASGDPLDKLVSTGLVVVHGAQQPAVGHTRGASEHAAWVGRAIGDVGQGAAGGCPRRCGRQDNVNDERRERQRDKSPDKRCPVAPVTQPEHPGDHVGQHKKRHVDAADDHFPPRRLRHLDALLQPHRRDGAEEQPPVRFGLELPQRVRSEQCCRPPAEVIEQQHQREREPVAHDREYFAPATDAGRDEAGDDIKQQQFPIECEAAR